MHSPAATAITTRTTIPPAGWNGSRIGQFVSSAGDINGDGLSDLAISGNVGNTWVIFGKKSWQSTFDAGDIVN
jgi:hypothetical protein